MLGLNFAGVNCNELFLTAAVRHFACCENSSSDGGEAEEISALPVRLFEEKNNTLLPNLFFDPGRKRRFSYLKWCAHPSGLMTCCVVIKIMRLRQGHDLAVGLVVTCT